MELSKAEHKICAYTSAGYEAKEIASKLFRSYYTVVTHKKSIMEKNGFRNSAEMIMHFILEFGDPRKFIAVVFLAIQVSLFFSVEEDEFRKTRRTKITRTYKTARKNYV